MTTDLNRAEAQYSSRHALALDGAHLAGASQGDASGEAAQLQNEAFL